MLDGRIARLTHATSSFGIEYDSLADLVAFGVAPGILVYQLGARAVGALGLARGLAVRRLRRAPPGALQRAGRASVEKRHFLGLPIPAAADIVAATVLLYYFFGGKDAPTSTSSCCS